MFLDINTNPLNVREGNSTSYDIITSIPGGTRVVASQQNTWWRVFLPLPPAVARESRTIAGGLASGYAEAGTWADALSKTLVSDPPAGANRTILSGNGTRSSSFGATGDAADTVTYNFTVPEQRGNYDIYTTWPGDANAANVTYRVTHLGGTQDVVLNQTPAPVGSAGLGTKASPHLIRQNPYVVNHTTVGAPDEWNSYSPTGSGIQEQGPELLYRFDLAVADSVTIRVDHTGYPAKDVDIHLLNGPLNTNCIARGDWVVYRPTLAAGTYYIAIDSFGSNNNAASPYTLTVEFGGTNRWANSWVKLGTFQYAPNGAGSVMIREASVTGKVDSSLPAKVVADAIKVVPRITRRSAWVSNSFAARVNTSTTPVPSVLVKTDLSDHNDTDEMDLYAEVPIYASASGATANSSAIVGKAVTGQRFTVLARSGDWYRVQLTNGTAAISGWLLGDHLVGWKMNLVAGVNDWSLY